MKVNVEDIKLETGLHKTVPVQIAVESVEMAGQTVQFDRPFDGEAEIWNVGDRLLVKARVSGEATVECSRCLSPFSMPLEVSFEEEFMEGTPATQEDDEEEDDELEQRTVTYYSGDEINLSDSLRENVLLELPMKPLCDEDCQGLCSTCGTNLNEGTCTCGEETQVVDPRLAALKDLLRKPDTKS